MMVRFIDLARPKEQIWAFLFDLFSILLGSFFLGVCAQIALPLWFTPVPLSLFSFGVLLIGALYGGKRGALTVALYLFEGGMGLPMFAGLTGGVPVLFGACGGYHFGSVIAAFVVGALFERGWIERYFLSVFALLIGGALLLGCGVLWLALSVGWKSAVLMGCLPFLIGDLIKVGFIAYLLPTCWKIVKR